MHSPGPWKADRARHPDNTGGYDYAVTDQDNQIIAEAFEHTGYAGGTDRQYIIQPVAANARLIAAAPVLLEALEHIREATLANKPDMSPGVFIYLNDIVLKAIAKATADKARGDAHVNAVIQPILQAFSPPSGAA